MTNPFDAAFGQPVLGERENGSPYTFSHGGLTKREWFAGLAMGALVIHREVQLDHESKLPSDAIARMAIAQADALIAELSKEAK